jgi:adenine-specific DNA-methyltransferase
LPTTVDTRKQHGVHYTPPDLARFLAQRTVKGIIDQSKSIRVLDPACGDGELLIAAYHELRARGASQIELVGFDRDERAVQEARRRLAEMGCHSIVQRRDLVYDLESRDDCKYDVIITNPPYVRTQVLGTEVSTELASRYDLRGRIDLTHVFVAIASSLLTEGGTLGLLCSNRFMTTRAGANVRKLLQQSFIVSDVIDLGDSKPFSAAVLPAIVVATRATPHADSTRRMGRYARVYEEGDCKEAPEVVDLYTALGDDANRCIARDGSHFRVTVGTLRVSDSDGRTWSMSSADNEQWNALVRRNTWRTFGSLAKIRVGIKTTADSVFIRDDWHELPENIRPESSLLLPLLTHRNVEAWTAPSAPKTRVLYPYHLDSSKRRVVNMDDYPRAMAYLNEHRSRLASRKYVIEAGREWYEIWVPQKPAAWNQAKVVFPDISVEPRFSVDQSGAVVNGDCYWIGFEQFDHEDLAYLLVAVANSRFAVAFYDDVCGNKLYAGRRRWMTQYVNRIPVPDPESAVGRKIVQASRELCAARDGTAPDYSEISDLVDEAFSVASQGSTPSTSWSPTLF